MVGLDISYPICSKKYFDPNILSWLINSIFVSKRGWNPSGFKVAGLNIPFSPSGISINIIGFIVPATAIDPAVFPVSAFIITPSRVISPAMTSVTVTNFIGPNCVIELISFILVSSSEVDPSIEKSPILMLISLLPPDSPPLFVNIPFEWVKLFPANICALAFAG